MKQFFLAAFSIVFILAASGARAAGWIYDSAEDNMRGASETYATLPSEEVISLDFPYRGGSSLSVLLRNSQRHGGLNVMLKLSKGQLSCNHGGCRISAKFDEGKVTTFRASRASSGNSNVIFIDDPKGFLKKFRFSDKVFLEVPVWKYGDAQFSFRPKGLTWK